MSMRAIKIEPEGETAVIEITGSDVEQQNDSIHEHLGGYFDIVRLGPDACLLVDDEGLLKELQPNPLAMMITGHPMLVGTALIIGTQPGPEGEEFCDAPERFVKFAQDMQQIDQKWEEEKNDD